MNYLSYRSPPVPHPRVLVALTLLALLLGSPLSGQVAEKVVLVTLDGVRWQEVFRGADEAFLVEAAGVGDTDLYRDRYYDPDTERRRAKLMPFVWSTLVSEGQLWGDHDQQPGIALVSNGRNFSYPGYNELLVGFADSSIVSNRKIDNRNISVLEWLEQQKGLAGKTAAFASWDVFPFILNRERSGGFVNAGWERYHPGVTDEVIERMNQLQERSYREWDGVRFDNFTFTFALDYLDRREPTVLYLALGEPDDWAHAKRYGNYLDAIHRNDDMLRELWEHLQTSPAYRGRTTLILTVDHGRGRTLEDWTGHGADIAGSDEVWMGVLGAGIEARGLRTDVGTTTLAQIAPSVAAALGHDFAASDPRIAGPLPLFLVP